MGRKRKGIENNKVTNPKPPSQEGSHNADQTNEKLVDGLKRSSDDDVAIAS